MAGKPGIWAARTLAAGVWSSAVLMAAGLALSGGSEGALLQAGLLLLIATPAVRVAALCAEFARRGERAYAALCAAALALMALSFALGRAG